MSEIYNEALIRSKGVEMYADHLERTLDKANKNDVEFCQRLKIEILQVREFARRVRDDHVVK